MYFWLYLFNFSYIQECTSSQRFIIWIEIFISQKEGDTHDCASFFFPEINYESFPCKLTRVCDLMTYIMEVTNVTDVNIDSSLEQKLIQEAFNKRWTRLILADLWWMWCNICWVYIKYLCTHTHNTLIHIFVQTYYMQTETQLFNDILYNGNNFLFVE